ncbi:DUF4174 domain-containing protein [Funiculus sociatus GB2-A5]|uniref:DUF4174 domain-containing protein n=1 Tax=Funiculus sociatus GB2-A5 TaxID=2933946 RepID=A0ABV0JPW4_9CYAN|nr:MULTISPECIES: DUF4174 domain-containing protein [unclassified Trichocoleus]
MYRSTKSQNTSDGYSIKMITRSLILGLLAYLASSCSTMTLTRIEQPVAQSAGSTATAITSLLPLENTEQSYKEVASAQPPKPMFNLGSYQWKNRLLLVFAPTESSPNYQQQMQLLQRQAAGLNDRDLLVIELFKEGESRIENQIIDESTAAQLRNRFNITSEEFSVILVGKDGTQKRRDKSPVTPDIIFKQIDAMPMRRQEMQQRRS